MAQDLAYRAWAAKNCQMTWVAFSAGEGGDSGSVDVRGPVTFAAVIGDVLVGGAVNSDDRDGRRGRAAAQLGGGVRADGGEDRGVAGQGVGHDAAVADAGGVDPAGGDRHGVLDGRDH